MATIAYLRVSTAKQDLQNQELEVLRYANAKGLRVDEWIRVEMSSRRSEEERRIDELERTLQKGDSLVVTELSRLGRSLGGIVRLMDSLSRKGVDVHVIKQNMRLNGEQDMTAKIQIAMFGLMAEIERTLISERTKMGLEKARASGKRLGRRPGSTGRSKLDTHLGTIKELMAKKVTKANIAKIVGCSWTALDKYIKTRGLTDQEAPENDAWKTSI